MCISLEKSLPSHLSLPSPSSLLLVQMFLVRTKAEILSLKTPQGSGGSDFVSFFNKNIRSRSREYRIHKNVGSSSTLGTLCFGLLVQHTESTSTPTNITRQHVCGRSATVEVGTPKNEMRRKIQRTQFLFSFPPQSRHSIEELACRALAKTFIPVF